MTLPEDTLLENRYRIDGLLARGGMGVVYRAFDTNLNTPVAIKENFFQTKEAIGQFKQEALILARLRHTGLPRVTHHFIFEGRQYLVMDFVEGQDLWSIVEGQGEPLEEGQALDYIIQVCRAVEYLHRQTPPIIHRDIKPQNIKITPDDQAVLVDFGIAKEGIADSHTRAGARGVTPGFSPPEQYSGAGTSTASDIYALGATLYAVLTGQKPPNSVSLMVGGSRFKRPDEINTKLSYRASQAIISAMQVKAIDRPPSVAAWRQELSSIRDSLPAVSKKDTLPSGGPAKDLTQKEIKAPSPEEEESTSYWLVDSTGVGYPVTAEPLRLGRHSTADVVIDDLRVSRHHASVRTDGSRCFVRDENSANHTFLNGHPLGREWHPIKPGDVLVIGSARFHLTTTEPVKLAPPPSRLPSDQGSGVTTIPGLERQSSRPVRPAVGRSTGPALAPDDGRREYPSRKWGYWPMTLPG